MKKTLTLLLLFIGAYSYAQKYDYRWIMGYPYAIGNFEITFTQTSADTALRNRNIWMNNGQTTISDSSGNNLLFFTNAAKIYDRNDSIMMNGDSINYGHDWDSWGGYFYNYLQSIMGLPTANSSLWNMFHYYIENSLTTEPAAFSWRLYQTRVDMSKNMGLGKVVYKNKTVLQDTIGSYVTACKHANGRDWWIITNDASTNCLYTLLVQDDTVIQYPLQCLGDSITTGDAGQAAFSPDGNKFACLGGGYNGIYLYDFDRCSGELSNPVHLPVYAGDVLHNPLAIGISFSPNSRFVYVSQMIYLYQFDTWASGIMASMDTVGFYSPPPPDGVSGKGTFFLMQLAPDGKIYMSANNGMKYLHVINQPDRLGDSCNFVNYGFPLPNINTFGIPNYPNYRLGRMVGSACDTIHTDVGIATIDDKQLQVYPNPASDYVVIDYGYNDWSKGEIRLEVSNDLGQIVHLQKLPMYSGFQKLDITAYSNGLYSVCIKRGNTIVYTSKFVKK